MKFKLESDFSTWFIESILGEDPDELELPEVLEDPDRKDLVLTHATVFLVNLKSKYGISYVSEKIRELTDDEDEVTIKEKILFRLMKRGVEGDTDVFARLQDITRM